MELSGGGRVGRRGLSSSLRGRENQPSGPWSTHWPGGLEPNVSGRKQVPGRSGQRPAPAFTVAGRQWASQQSQLTHTWGSRHPLILGQGRLRLELGPP